MKRLFITLLMVAALILAYLGYSGLFAPVNIVEKEIGPLTIVYEEYIGDYKNTGKIQNKIYQALKNDFKIDATRGIGIYYDNPENVEKDKLRSDVGCVLEEKDFSRIHEIKSKMNVKKYDARISAVAEMPFKNNISIIIGIMRVYPKMMEYFKDKGLIIEHGVEIYDVPGRKITYAIPLGKM